MALAVIPVLSAGRSPGDDFAVPKQRHVMHVARGDLLLMTDADCVIPPSWVEGTCARFTPGVGVVGGLTVQRAKGPFEGAQSLDWTFLLGIAAATIGLVIASLAVLGMDFVLTALMFSTP